MRRLIATATLSLCALAAVDAGENAAGGAHLPVNAPAPVHRFVPAYFVPGPRSLQRLLACPEGEVPRKPVSVRCKVAVSAEGSVEQGKSSGTFCAAPNGGREAFRSVAMHALSAARFTPASIDGRPVPVYASVLSLFIQKGAACHAVALLNGGTQDPAVGIDYVEPQVVRDSPDWSWQRRVAVPTRYVLPQLVHVARSPGTLFLRMSVAVAADGTVSDGRVDEVYRLGHVDSLNAVRALEGSRFIPGFHRGMPAAMRYHEMLWVNTCATEIAPWC